MATELDSFDFPKSNTTKYPWSEWENGRPWRIVRGEDFTVSTVNVRALLYQRAKTVNRRVRVASEGDDALVFQFYDSSNGTT